MRKKSSLPLKMSVGAGLGVGLLGALALAVRFGWQRSCARNQIPEEISPAIFATRVVNTPEGEIVYHTSGNGNPLLFLHGVFPGASSFEWSKIYPSFALQHHVLVPDLIGFGESQRPRQPITTISQVHALAKFLDTTTDGTPVTIIASGLSANLALLFSSCYPNKVARLLLWMPLLAIQGMPSLAQHHRLAWSPLLARIAYQRHFSTEAYIKQWLLRSGFSTEHSALQEVITVLTSTAQQYGSEHAFLAQSSARFWRNLRSQLSPITAPVTLLMAQGSERLTEEAMISLRPFVSHFSITEIETTSLLAPLIDPSLLITALSDVL
jgi:haloalkane dehalogenase